MTPLEIAANALNTLAILLAGRNSIHTWWTGILGAACFGKLFYDTQLYADATLQLFFLATSLSGWWQWMRKGPVPPPPIRRTTPQRLAKLTLLGLLVTGAYGALLHYNTNAYAPFADSAVLAFSVIAQFLLMARHLENWWLWLIVNTISVPLFYSRGLYLTSALYAVYWVNALISLRHWQRLHARESAAQI